MFSWVSLNLYMMPQLHVAHHLGTVLVDIVAGSLPLQIVAVDFSLDTFILSVKGFDCEYNSAPLLSNVVFPSDAEKFLDEKKRIVFFFGSCYHIMYVLRSIKPLTASSTDP